MQNLPANDIIQWGAVIAIVLIAAITIIKKIMKFRSTVKNGKNPDCGCGCCSCDAGCALRDNNSIHKSNQHKSTGP